MSTTSSSNRIQPAVSTLPKRIADYFSAINDRRLADAASCFASDAQVHDENQDHQGREAIQDWIAETTRKYQPKNEVLSSVSKDDRWAVIAKVSGTFPGSPVELTFHFMLRDAQITGLSIG